jgi:hypothetical protein
MIVEVAMTMIVVLGILGTASLVIGRVERSMRRWYWFAVAEYLVCGVVQMVWARLIAGGGDTVYYARSGTILARFLSANFTWAAQELFSMLIQQQSAFSGSWEGAGSNTGSMCAISAFLVFFTAGSEMAPHFLITGLSLFAVLSIFRACREACPEAPPIRLFVATVLFPSVAFWTSALHKESFCVIGVGLILAGWRALNRGAWLRFVACAPLGFAMVLLFRTPVVPPLVSGLVVFFMMDRMKRARGVGVALAPVYLAIGIGVLVAAMVVVSRVSPRLGADQIGDTFAMEASRWHTQGSAGGSAIDGVVGGEKGLSDKERLAMGPQSLAGQLAGVPFALINSLFRPQLFDAHNFGTLLSAVEMTIITFLVLRAIKQHGFGGLFSKVRQSPFLMMCAVITIVGCTGVGLVTLNFGTLARYRVPFLPFYGSLILILARSPAPAPSAAPLLSRDRLRRPRSAASR